MDCLLFDDILHLFCSQSLPLAILTWGSCNLFPVSNPTFLWTHLTGTSGMIAGESCCRHVGIICILKFESIWLDRRNTGGIWILILCFLIGCHTLLNCRGCNTDLWLDLTLSLCLRIPLVLDSFDIFQISR